MSWTIIGKGGTGGGESPLNHVGWANYINGDLTPISVPAATETKLTMDASTGTIVETFLPVGVSSLWDSVNSQFDFSSLSIGDMVDIRIDGSLTNSGFNESFVLNMVNAVGSPSEFTLPFASGNRLFAGTSIVSRYNGVYIGFQDMIDFPSELRILTTDASEGFLVDVYIKILKAS